MYQHLLEAGFEEFEIEKQIGDGYTLQQIYDQAVEDGLITIE